MEDLPVTSVLSLFDTTKQQRIAFAQSIIQRMLDGNVSPLKVHIQLKCMEDIIKKLLENNEYKSLVLDEANANKGTRFELHNAEISVRETGIKYDYSKCNDPIYASLDEAHKKASEALKAREKFLQAIPISGVELLLEGGEVVRAYPPSKSSTTSPVVTLK